MTIRIEVPLTLPSMANMRLHWAKKARLVKAQRTTVAWCLKSSLLTDFIGRRDTATGFVVTLTRVAPRRLDSDNLVSAFKATRDQVAAYLGIDDGHAGIEWRYDQLKGPAMVRIELRVEAR